MHFWPVYLDSAFDNIETMKPPAPCDPFDDSFPGSREFPLDPPGYAFLNRDAIFLDALKALLGLCSRLGLPPPDVFISYAHNDGAYERWIIRELVPLLRLAGLRVILDQLDNGPGSSLTRFIDLIKTCRFVLVMGTPAFGAKSSPQSGSTVAREVQRIEERMQDDSLRDTVIPVLVAGDVVTSLPAVLRQTVYTDLRDPELSHARLFDLILVLRGALRHEEMQIWRHALQDGRPPRNPHGPEA